MNDELSTARDHYQAAIADTNNLVTRIASALDAVDAPLTAQRTGNFDQFHIGGLASSAELAARVGITHEMRVLDAGSGLGGPSRYLAETFGCQVTGVDLAPAYVAIAQMLATKAGLNHLVSYLTGSITALPFPAASFDLIWTQHVVMNIRDRDSLYREFRRVLKPGARLAFYDPYVPVGAEPPHYPVPWAESAAASTLLTEPQTCASLEQAGFKVQTWQDVSGMAKGWLLKQQQAAGSANPQAPTLGWVVGPRMPAMVANFARNINEGRVGLVMGICEAV